MPFPDSIQSFLPSDRHCFFSAIIISTHKFAFLRGFLCLTIILHNRNHWCCLCNGYNFATESAQVGVIFMPENTLQILLENNKQEKLAELEWVMNLAVVLLADSGNCLSSGQSEELLMHNTREGEEREEREGEGTKMLMNSRARTQHTPWGTRLLGAPGE